MPVSSQQKPLSAPGIPPDDDGQTGRCGGVLRPKLCLRRVYLRNDQSTVCQYPAYIAKQGAVEIEPVLPREERSLRLARG